MAGLGADQHQVSLLQDRWDAYALPNLNDRDDYLNS